MRIRHACAGVVACIASLAAGDEVDTLIYSTGYLVLSGASPIDLGRDDVLPMRPETPADLAAFRARWDSLMAKARSR